jgi:hypothetical protein
MSVFLQSGVSEVIYFVEKRIDSDYVYVASHKLLSMAGVKVLQVFQIWNIALYVGWIRCRNTQSYALSTGQEASAPDVTNTNQVPGATKLY